jgi:hypothetical protein
MATPTLELIGYGAGYGDGDGDGSGYGYGGHGDGSGDGYGGDGYGGAGYGYGGGGDGSGYGGYGTVYGDGDGSGYGSGNGGYGYGGSGNGDGERKQYLQVIMEPFAQPEAEIAFWRSDAEGNPVNGGSFSVPVSVGRVEEIKGPLKICTNRALHGTLDPKQWKGERWWIVALHHPVQIQGDKIGSLKRTILCDLGKCPF